MSVLNPMTHEKGAAPAVGVLSLDKSYTDQDEGKGEQPKKERPGKIRAFDSKKGRGQLKRIGMTT